FAHDAGDHTGGVLAIEGARAREHFIQHAAEREQIASRCGSLAVQTTITVSNAANIQSGTRLWVLISAGNPTSSGNYGWAEERMLVTGVSGNTLTVQRGVEGSTAAAFASGKAFGTLTYANPPDAGFKSLHPAFLLTFYPGWAGVKTQVMV